MDNNELIFAGHPVNIENARKTTREGFIERFLPQLVFFSNIPIEDRAEELGKCWDMCQQEPGTEVVIPESHLVAAKTKENEPVDKRGKGKMGKDAIEPIGNGGGNRTDGE